MKHSAIRQTIVETASELFYQKGYNLTGINEIISEAGIAKATLYSHFSSKEDICIAYLKYKNNSFVEDIKAFVLKRTAGKEQLLSLFDYLLIFFNDKDFNGCWCINTVSEIPTENQKIRTEIQFQKNQFIAFIEELAINCYPNHSPKENKELARQLYLMYEGAVAESHLHQDSWPIEAAKVLCNKILL